MKLAIQHTLLPGATLTEKFDRAADFGFQGVELAAWGFEKPMSHYADEIRGAVRASGMEISSLCTQSADDFVHPDAAERAKRIEGLAQYLQLADELGAAGVVALPIRKAVRLPDLSPIGDEISLTTQLTVAALHTALSMTQSARAAVFLEPLNRYETHYLNTVGQAAELCRSVGSDRVKIMADLFHMSIEEAQIARAAEAVIGYIGHIHLADSNRLEPGQGHTDFTEVFEVLKLAGYTGWMAFECRISSDPDHALPGAVKLLRDCWAQA